jgi:hypothetical protein
MLRSAEAVDLGWPESAKQRRLVRTRAGAGALELRPAKDVLSHIFQA